MKEDGFLPVEGSTDNFKIGRANHKVDVRERFVDAKGMNEKLHAQKAPINFNLVRVNWQRKNCERNALPLTRSKKGRIP